jgi:hypothetical protein
MIRFIFADTNTLTRIECEIAARLECPYVSHEWIAENGYLPIHESYYNTIIGVLKEFDGEFEVKELVEVKVNDDGSEELVFRNVDKSQLFTE